MQAGVAFLNPLQLLNDHLRRPGQHAAVLNGVLNGGQPRVGRHPRVADVPDLLLGQPPRQTQRPEHFEVLLVVLARLPRRFLNRGRNLEMEAHRQILAQLGLRLAVPPQGIPVGVHNPVHRPAFRRTPADDALDAHLRHKLQRPPGAALNRLPALHRQRPRARHQRQLLQLVAPVGNLRRKVVMLAVMDERLLVERLENDLHLLLKKLPVGRLVQQRRTKGLHLPGMVAPPHAESDPPLGHNVRHGEILRQPQRMPHRRDVEPAPEAQPFRKVRQMHNEHQQVGDAFVPLRLEVVLRHPEGVVPVPVQALGNGHALVKGRRQVFVGKRPVVHRRAAVAQVVHINMAGVQTVKSRNHQMPPNASARCEMRAANARARLDCRRRASPPAG